VSGITTRQESAGVSTPVNVTLIIQDLHLFDQQAANEKGGDEGPVLLPNPNGRESRMKAVKELKVILEGRELCFPAKLFSISKAVLCLKTDKCAEQLRRFVMDDFHDFGEIVQFGGEAVSIKSIVIYISFRTNNLHPTVSVWKIRNQSPVSVNCHIVSPTRFLKFSIINFLCCAKCR
jgi:hypothetical protein